MALLLLCVALSATPAVAQKPSAERPTYAVGETWALNGVVYTLKRIESDLYVFTAPGGHELRVTRELVVARAVRNGRVVNSFHDWGVVPSDLGPDLVALALAPDGTVEAARHRTLPHVCVMWHPEREPSDDDDLAMIRALVEGA